LVLTDSGLQYFLSIPFRVRAAFASGQAIAPFIYADEPFFADYLAVERLLQGRSQRLVAEESGIGRDRLGVLVSLFEEHGTLGLLPEVGMIEVDPRLEHLTILVKSARPHERANVSFRQA